MANHGATTPRPYVLRQGAIMLEIKTMLKLSIGTSLALATLAAALTATPSLAGTRHVSAANAVTANQAYAAAPGYAYAGSRLVIVNGQVVGADPDANVRLQLTKDAENANQ
jgi:uncharacterized transporter YbjL